jgi:hypothetical protein
MTVEQLQSLIASQRYSSRFFLRRRANNRNAKQPVSATWPGTCRVFFLCLLLVQTIVPGALA